MLRVHVLLPTDTLSITLPCLAAAFNGANMDPEQFGINVVPYYIDASLQPHVLSVEQLQSHSAADLEFLLAHADQAIPSMEVLISISVGHSMIQGTQSAAASIRYYYSFKTG